VDAQLGEQRLDVGADGRGGDGQGVGHGVGRQALGQQVQALPLAAGQVGRQLVGVGGLAAEGRCGVAGHLDDPGQLAVHGPQAAGGLLGERGVGAEGLDQVRDGGEVLFEGQRDLRSALVLRPAARRAPSIR
jgi:hypothetical protein